MCNDLCVETVSGDIDVTSLYAAQSYFNTRRGNVSFGNCHKEAMVNIQHTGNLKIGKIKALGGIYTKMWDVAPKDDV